MRVGWGIDVHRFGGNGPLRLGGVTVASDRGLIGTSDADVLAHAVTDALLGAAALGDMGTHFPSSDPTWHGADSMGMLRHAAGLLSGAGYRVGSVDATVVAESVRIAPHREAMRERIASVLGIDPGAVSIKATTTDGLGMLGRDEGIAALAVAVVEGIDAS